MQIHTAVIELGGTNINVGIATLHQGMPKILCKTRLNTGDPEETVIQIVEWLNQQNLEFNSVNIASFGPLSLDKGAINYGSITGTPKLKWQHYPIGPILSERLGKPFVIETDVNACAMAEYQLGNHVGVKRSLAYVTVGTGVGVGLIVNGECVHGMLHPEGGHIRVQKLPQDADFKGVCAYHGDCLEGLCTNVSAAARLKCNIDDLPNLRDDHPIWEQIGYYLAQMCVSLCLILSIEKIVLGGGVMNRKVLFSIIDKHVRQMVNGYVELPVDYIVAASKEDIGLIGALIIDNIK